MILTVGACERGNGGAPADPTPSTLSGRIDVRNVVLISVDTLRADHLSCYGAEIETPNLCRLAEAGTTYQAFSHASWTKPATASLLSSTLPSTHGAIAKPSALSPDLTLISEAMQAGGYTTGGIVSNTWLAESFGFAQGYDDYYVLAPDYIARAKEFTSSDELREAMQRAGVQGPPEFWFAEDVEDKTY